MMVQEPGWEFGRDTGVSTPTLAMSATGSLVTTGSQDLGFKVKTSFHAGMIVFVYVHICVPSGHIFQLLRLPQYPISLKYPQQYQIGSMY